MVGAVVFTNAGFALDALGSRAWVLLAWSVGGVIAIAGAVSYGALAQALRESGGEYVYLARRVHPLVGFLAGWVSLFAGFTGALAFAAAAFETYSAPLVGMPLPAGTLAVMLILGCALQHSLGVAGGAGLQNVVVAIKLLGLLVLIVFGVWQLGERSPLAPEANALFTWTEFGRQLTWVFLAYAGFNAAVYVTEEVRDAERTLPRAMLAGTLIVVLLYLALNAVFVYSGQFKQLAGEPDVAARAMQLLGGDTAETACRVLICLALATSASALTMSGPRVYAKMASDGLFPLPVPNTGQPPRAAIALQATLAVVVVLTTGLQQQLDYLGFTLMLSSAVAVGTLLWVRGENGELQASRPQLVAASSFVAAALLLGLLTAARSPAPTALAGGVTLATGVVAYFAMLRRNGPRQK